MCLVHFCSLISCKEPGLHDTLDRFAVERRCFKVIDSLLVLPESNNRAISGVPRHQNTTKPCVCSKHRQGNFTREPLVILLPTSHHPGPPNPTLHNFFSDENLRRNRPSQHCAFHQQRGPRKSIAVARQETQIVSYRSVMELVFKALADKTRRALRGRPCGSRRDRWRRPGAPGSLSPARRPDARQDSIA